MAQFYLMPQASPTMTVGVIAKWAVSEGQALSPSMVVAQVETDKATMDIETFDKGFMRKLLAQPGDEVPPDFPIAIVAASLTEDISALEAEYVQKKAALGKAAPAAPAVEAAPVAAPVVAAPVVAAPVAAPVVAPAAPEPAPITDTVAPVLWMGKPLDSSVMETRASYRVAAARIVASPLAKAVAADKGIDLKRIKGSGPGGRIVVEDVEKAAAAPAVAPAAGNARQADVPTRVTQMRKTIARRLSDVHQQVPVFYLTVTFDAAKLVALKDQAGLVNKKISYNDLVIKAVARALRDVPECNAAWQGDSIVRRGNVDIGVAVALPEGLITPIIRDADRKGVAEIAAEVRTLAGRAKDGKLSAEEYTGGTFTISNLGMFGIEHFTAILNPPEAGILAVGGVQQLPVVENGQLAVGWRMKATLTCDHRVIDGALGARFLAALRAYIETPALLVL